MVLGFPHVVSHVQDEEHVPEVEIPTGTPIMMEIGSSGKSVFGTGHASFGFTATGISI